MGNALNSILYQPEDEYNQDQATQFVKEAQAKVFPMMAQRQVSVHSQAPPPEQPPPLEPGSADNLLGGVGNAIGSGLGQVGQAIDTNPITQGLASATNTGMKALGDLSGLGNTVVPYLPQTGFDLNKAKEMASQNASKAQQERESQMLNNPPGALLNAALTYPGTQALNAIPAAPAVEAMARAGAAKVGETTGRLAADEAGAIRIAGQAPVNLPPGQETALTKLEGALAPEQTKLMDSVDKFVRNFYDKNAPLMGLGEKTGLPVHEQAQVVSGARAYGEDIIRKQVEPVLAPLGKDIPVLERYMVLKRGEDVLSRNPSAKLPGGINGWNELLDAQHGLAAAIGPDRMAAVEGAANALWGAPGKPQDGLIFQYILKPLQDEGIITADEVRAMQTAHPHYIDFGRLLNGKLASAEGGGQQVASVGSTGLHEMALAGSERTLSEPLAGTLAQFITVQERVARNKAASTLFDALDSIGQAEIKSGLKTTAGNVPVQTGPGLAAPGNGTMDFYRNGEKIVAEVPQVFADIAKGLEAQTAGVTGKILMKLATPLRTGATTYNPAFVVINPIRDFITAGFKESWRTVVGPEYIQGWVAALTKNQAFSDAAKDGALMGGLIDSFTKTADLTKIAGNRALGIPMDSVGDLVKFVPRLIRDINSASERATRIGTYLYRTNQGDTGLEAAVRARNVTVDFAKSGNVTQVINQAIPFLNAGIQGAGNTISVMKSHPEQALIKAAPLGMASILFDQWNQRYESSSLIPDYEYRNNWIVMTGEGKASDGSTYPVYLKIPKGPTGALLTIPVEMGLRYAKAKGDYSVTEDLLGSLWDAAGQLSPVSLSPSSLMLPGLGTAAEMAANKDLYTGREIVPQGEMNRPPELRYGQESSRGAIALGEKTGISPRLIDFAIKDYTAGTGQAGNWLADMALGALGYNPPIPGEAKLQPKTPTEQLAQTPIVSRFLGVRNTEQDRQGYAKFNQTLQQSQRDFSKIPETLRLGVTMGQVGDTINGTELTIPQRTEYQRLTAEATIPATKAVINTDYFKKASDADKTAMVQRARALAGDYVRPYVIPEPGQKPYDPSKLPSLAEAIAIRAVAEQVYTTIPKYNPATGLTEPQLAQVTAAVDRMKKDIAANPKVTQNVALRMAYDKEKQSGTHETALQWAYAFISNPGRYENPTRKQFRDKFLGGIDIPSD